MYRPRRSQFKIDKAYEMRHNPTLAEARMWEIITSQVTPNFPNHIFYRQSVQYGYILDFYCPTLRLGIEVDGGIHNDQKGYDKERDSNLAWKGIQVLRTRNEDVFNNPHILARELCQIIQDKTTPWYNCQIKNEEHRKRENKSQYILLSEGEKRSPEIIERLHCVFL